MCVNNPLAVATHLRLENTDLLGNWAKEGKGGGLFAQFVEVDIVGCEFNGNTSHQGGAVLLHQCNVETASSYFRYNATSSDGGAMFLQACQSEVRDCIFEFNGSGGPEAQSASRRVARTQIRL
jgi:hypothetical protein